MATQEKTWNVANRLHSLKDSDNPEVNHIITGADEIYDDAKGAKQSDINAQTDAALADRYTKAETYSKEQLDALITTPDVNYVSVVATNATTAVTDILPATGEANTIYRVGNWDGTQYDSTMYALFAWNGTTYVCLAVRSFVGEVYDISVNHPDGQGNPTPYADLTAALGISGANVPADIRRGGMSIKFIQGTVQSSNNKYVQARCIAQNFTTDTTQWTIAEEGVYVENPEFIYVKTDAEGKILWAIKADGGIYFGAGVPQQVIDYIEQKIEELSLEEYEDIVAFLNGLEEGDKTLQTLLNEKVDKVEGKSLIDEDIANDIHYIENPEFKKVYLDNSNNVLWGIRTDGTIYYGAGVPQQIISYINDRIEKLSLDEYEDIVSFLDNLETEDKTLRQLLFGKVDKEENKSLIPTQYITEVNNPEFVKVWLDNNDKILFGIKKDGDFYFGSGVPSKIIEYVETGLSAETNRAVAVENTKVNKEDNKGLIPLQYIEEITNPEYIKAILDSDRYVICALRNDGVFYIPVGLLTDFIQAKRINADSIIPKSIILPNDALQQNYEYTKEKSNAEVIYKNWYIPKFGEVAIKEETFYLTADGWSSYTNDVILIQTLDYAVAVTNGLPASYFYIKSTLTPLPGGGYDRTSVNENSVKLDFYVPKDILKVNDADYVKSTLTEIVDPITGDISYEVNVNSVEVRKVTDSPHYLAWTVDKEIEHYCKADIDFGDYYTKTNAAVSIKYQGNSTLYSYKRGFRLTFYKNADYKKKLKVKIGEMLRLSGFNMKSYYVDPSRIKDPFISRLCIEAWESNATRTYPWSKDSVAYSGATGIITSFPIETYFGNESYGLQIFALKKDEKNYMLDGDDDASGIFAQANAAFAWSNFVPSQWDDEMGADGRTLYNPSNEDSLSVESVAAMQELFKYIAGFISGSIEIDGQVVDFENSMLEERIDIPSFVDYWIFLQVFMLWDNEAHNMILHSRADKKKFYPFFYDVDNSFSGTYDADILDYDEEHQRDNSFWIKFIDEYKDEIINRYFELRKSVLSFKNLESVYETYIQGIPQSVIDYEVQTWNSGNPREAFKPLLEKLKQRLTWLDTNSLLLN